MVQKTNLNSAPYYDDFDKDKNFVLINSNKLPFKNNEFDYVYASHVIEHVEDVAFFIEEIQRISRMSFYKSLNFINFIN